MPIGTPFHERTFALCESLNYREWSGYYAVSSYETTHEHEYNAIRNAAALIDVSPLFKYRIRGRDATRLVDRLVTRDMRKISVGQVIYTPWCVTRGTIAGISVEISRTGYTGDLGYEIWMAWEDAPGVWDALMEGGRPFDIRPAGMLALDVARIEAGLLLIEVDFRGSKIALIDS